MLNVLAPGVVSSAANPVLDFWAQAPVVDGAYTYLAPALPYALAFQILDVRNADAPAQIFPVTFGQRHAVDLTADKIDGLVGHYAAAWTAVSADKKGRYQIRWFYTPSSTSAEVVSSRDFDVLPAALSALDAGLGYILPSDMRDEQVTATMATDAQILKRIALASRFVERVTGRAFSPVFKTVQLEPNADQYTLEFGEPVISLSSVTVADTDLLGTQFRVSNRHIAENLIDPDDRTTPTLEFWSDQASSIVSTWNVFGLGRPFYGASWWFDHRNHRVTARGLFGYTEYDGSPVGRTPLLIQQATKLIVMRELEPIGSTRRGDARQRSRVTSERTRDQQYTLQEQPLGAFTGDIEIDTLLAAFCRPMRIGSV